MLFTLFNLTHFTYLLITNNLQGNQEINNPLFLF